MRTSQKNRLHNILKSAKIKLKSLVSDVFGVSSFHMVQAIAKGETDSVYLVSMAKGSLVKKHEGLIKALNGKVTAHHRYMLNLILQTIEHINLQIAQLEAHMDKYKNLMLSDVADYLKPTLVLPK